MKIKINEVLGQDSSMVKDDQGRLIKINKKTIVESIEEIPPIKEELKELIILSNEEAREKVIKNGMVNSVNTEEVEDYIFNHIAEKVLVGLQERGYEINFNSKQLDEVLIPEEDDEQ